MKTTARLFKRHQVKVEIQCPYCFTKNIARYDVRKLSDLIVVVCDVDEGGCDKSFILSCMRSISKKALMIEAI